jgi:ABC-type antimicrobial peptide transport system permease subunit
MTLGVLVAVVASAATIVSVFAVAPRIYGTENIVDPITVPWPALAWGASAALVASALGAVIPACKATRLPIADAMRI